MIKTTGIERKLTMKANKINVGQLLMKSLTSDQIAQLLNVVASGVDLSRYMDDLKKADPDMAATVGKVLKSRGAKAEVGAGTRLASDQRSIENWNSLWRQWNDVVAEVGDEDGKFQCPVKRLIKS